MFSDKIKYNLIVIIITILGLLIYFAAFNYSKKISYNIKYKTEVKNTIKEIIKPECIKEYK